MRPQALSKEALWYLPALGLGAVSLFVTGYRHSEMPFFDSRHIEIAIIVALLAVVFSAFFRFHTIRQHGALRAQIVSETKRREAETALKSTERIMKTAELVFHFGSFEWDIVENKHLWSDEIFRIVGVEPQSVDPAEMILADLWHPEDKKRVQGVLNEAVERGGAFEFQSKVMRPDGTYRTWQARGEVFHDAFGKPILMSGMVQDISERKELEAQLRNAQKMEAIGTLAGGIAHNFNNLLQIMSGGISILRAHMGPDDAKEKTILSRLEATIDRGSMLTEQILGLARGRKYFPIPMNLNGNLTTMIAMFSETRKEIEFINSFEENLWPIEGDKFQIEEILLNIFVNASQAMPRGGKLYINTKNVQIDDDFANRHDVKSGKFASLSITDTGIGMDEATKQRVFEPFFTTRAVGDGTGLGLASTFGIVRNHGGIITVESEVGKGSTFNLFFPATDLEIIELKDPPQKETRGKGMVLLVDDEEAIIEISRGMLELLGYNILVAGGGEESLVIFEKNMDKIDLVILDMIMPKMSGAMVFDKMREMKPDIKVLLSSGYSMGAQAEEIMERGCNGFIKKPYDMGTLAKKIHLVLDQAPRD